MPDCYYAVLAFGGFDFEGFYSDFGGVGRVDFQIGFDVDGVIDPS